MKKFTIIYDAKRVRNCAFANRHKHQKEQQQQMRSDILLNVKLVAFV